MGVSRTLGAGRVVALGGLLTWFVFACAGTTTAEGFVPGPRVKRKAATPTTKTPRAANATPVRVRRLVVGGAGCEYVRFAVRMRLMRSTFFETLPPANGVSAADSCPTSAYRSEACWARQRLGFGRFKGCQSPRPCFIARKRTAATVLTATPYARARRRATAMCSPPWRPTPCAPADIGRRSGCPGLLGCRTTSWPESWNRS